LEGVGISFALSYLAYTAMMAVVVWRMTGFRWSALALKILVPSALVLGAVLACTRFLPESWSIGLGLAATAVAGGVSLLALQKLLDVNLWRTVRLKFHANL
jgi:protein-S-isoprenylcysteine O-methyltransferase Ste14